VEIEGVDSREVALAKLIIDSGLDITKLSEDVVNKKFQAHIPVTDGEAVIAYNQHDIALIDELIEEGADVIIDEETIVE